MSLSASKKCNSTLGVSIFRKKDGISAGLTPVSKKFAPAYASTFSLAANTICY